MKKIAFLIGAILVSKIGFAQVLSSMYNRMLQGLLDHTAKEISVIEAKNLKEVQFVDAREKDEYEVSHLPDACWSGYETFSLSHVEDLDTSKPVIVYCSVGYRSEKIANKLEHAGFTNVYNLYGGIFEWVNQGNAVVDTNGIETKKVHAYSRIWGVWLNKGDKVY